MTTLGRNVGDEFIRDGVRAALTEIGTVYEPFFVDKHDPNSIREVRAEETSVLGDKYWESDIFVQTGAPVYWNLSPEATSLTSEWYNWLWEDRIFATPERRKPLFLNLGAGSCQRPSDTYKEFLSSPQCATFARAAHAAARLTTVRDPLAKAINNELGLSVEALPCPAFFAAKNYAPTRCRQGLIGVNIMENGGHFDLDSGATRRHWSVVSSELVKNLRTLGPLCFIAHDKAEAEYMGSIREPGERVFWSSSWRDLIELYRSCEFTVCNRVHGAVLAAGFGRPSIVIGNDSRTTIVDFLKLPRFDSGDVEVQEVVQTAASIAIQSKQETERLIGLRDSSFNRFSELLNEAISQS